MQTIAGITALLVSSTPGATLPTPSAATDGVDITSWRVGFTTPVNYDIATVYIAADGAATLTAPANLWGLRNGTWWLLGPLNGNANVTITGVGQGYAQRINEIGIFSRMAVSCASVTGGRNYTVSFEPIALRND